MNNTYKWKTKWDSLLEKRKISAFGNWCKNRDREYIREKMRKYTNGRFKEEIEAEMLRNKGGLYKKRPLI